jgi:hypothetical protein
LSLIFAVALLLRHLQVRHRNSFVQHSLTVVTECLRSGVDGARNVDLGAGVESFPRSHDST